MKHVINFSASTSYKFDVDEDLANAHYLESTKDFIMDVYRCRGYIYLNQIYENLGVSWNPENDNLLFRYIDDGVMPYWTFDIYIEELKDEPGYNFVIDIPD